MRVYDFTIGRRSAVFLARDGWPLALVAELSEVSVVQIAVINDAPAHEVIEWARQRSGDAEIHQVLDATLVVEVR